MLVMCRMILLALCRVIFVCHVWDNFLFVTYRLNFVGHVWGDLSCYVWGDFCR